MKKSTPRFKAAQGCKKISSFFSSVQPLKSPVKPITAPEATKEVIIIESEDEESESLLHFNNHPHRYKRKFDNETSGISPPMKKPSEEMSPQPSTSGLAQLDKVGEIHVTNLPHLMPSITGTTPVKNNLFISVKTPEKLLTPRALKELQSPALKQSSITPPSAKKRTPRKTDSTKGKSRRQSSSETSPTKIRQTPRKLFERSPSNLNEFNVEVLENFVKITPTKKEIDFHDKPECKKSLEVQFENEKTPVKDIIPSSIVGTSASPSSKVRTKLDFSTFSKVIENKQPSKISTKENLDTNNSDLTFEDDSWGVDFMIDQMDFNLDLSKSQHCKIININQRNTETILTLESTQTKEQALCTLRGYWVDSKLSIGDIVHAAATKMNDSWIIDNDSGLLVFEPDLLISTTSIAGSVFCKRQAIFKEKFRGFDMTNKYMIVGSMVHSLIQEVLRNKLYQLQSINKCALDILNRNEWTRQVYESGEPMSFISEEFLNYIPKVYDFVKEYVLRERVHKNDNWKGVITSVEDIEENIWCPELGVKGKVDISIKAGKVMMPIEVKTGRASVSLAHQGQVLLYVMMMNKLGYPVSSGLLLYLKEGILKEIPPTASEQRDILILRNELAYFLSKGPKVVESSNGTFLEPAEAPEPINHPACKNCGYNSICMAYSQYTNEDLKSKKNLKQVHNDLSKFVTSAHIDYFMHWVSLISMEMSQRNGSKELRDIYTLPAEERKKKGKCLINLQVVKVQEEPNGVCFTTFGQNSDNLLLSGFTENTYVVVSLNNRPAVAAGFITNIDVKSVTVSLDRNLTKKYNKQTFFIDSYDSTAFLTYNLASLALILDTSDHANQLRSIVIDRQPATFQLKLPISLAEKARPILKRLNRVQQRAILKAIAANEYFLIKGMPGTGKTTVIVALIQLLVEIGKTVLITSHTHSAVDTVCKKLIDFKVKFMRLGNESKMDQSIREYSEENLTKHCSSPDALEAVYSGVKVLAVTCLGAGHSVLSRRFLDVCIVDESTQVLQCSIFRPLHVAKTFILIGDPDQLPAVVKNKTASDLGMSESLFERLDTDECRVSLNLNYRMNEPITALANQLTYKGELLIGSERIAKASLKVPKWKQLVERHGENHWVVKTLDMKIGNAVQFVDTGPIWGSDKNATWASDDRYKDEESKHCVNIFEAAIVYRLVQTLVLDGQVPPEKIGVIATYRVQVALLTELLKSFNVDVNTVDQFQGKDNNVIIYSCSKSRDISEEWKSNEYDLTEDKRRLNVAITRAKHKLIIVGDLATLQNYSTFRIIKDNLRKNVIELMKCDGFQWDDVLDIRF